MNLRTPMLCVLALIPALLLSSCSIAPLLIHPADARPTPRPQRTVGGGLIVNQYGESRQIPVRVEEVPSDEVVDAATQSADDWLIALHSALNVGHFEKGDFDPYITGALLSEMNGSDGHLLPNGFHSEGTTRAVGINVQRWDATTGTLIGLLCERREGIRLIDPAGIDVTVPGSSDLFQSAVTITGLPDDPKVAEYVRYPNLDDC